MSRKKSTTEGDPTATDGLDQNGHHADPSPAFDLVLGATIPPAPVLEPIPASPAPPPPVAVPAPAMEAQLVPLEERLRKLEDALNRLTQVQREPTPTLMGPNLLSAAQSLVEAGRQLVPTLRLEPASKPGVRGKLAFVFDLLVEPQAIYFMYVDPRYRLSWVGRVLPPVLLALFFTTGWWLKWFTCGIGEYQGVQNVVRLVMCYFMFKIVTAEARQYRQTAPDLPAHLRP